MILFYFGLESQAFLVYKSSDQSAQVFRILDMVTRRNVHYTPLATDEGNYIDGRWNRLLDPRFDYTPKALDKVPWKSIALALFLLFLGTVLLVISYFVFTGHMAGELSQVYGLLTLGLLSFLPGTLDSQNFTCKKVADELFVILYIDEKFSGS